MTPSQHASDQPDDDLVECRLCGRKYRSLGQHVRRAHNISPKEYRDQHGMRRGQPLTAPAARKRWQDRIADQIAAGSLEAHYATNAARGAAARAESQRVLREMRARGVPRRPSRPPRSHEALAAIVAAIEAGATRADALAAGSISESAFYTALRRHPDLKARMASVAQRKARRAKPVSPGPVARSALGRIIGVIHSDQPKASLLYARIAVALLDAPERTMTISDLSEALERGRDSSAVQGAISRLEAMRLVTRRLQPADQDGGSAWAVTLIQSR